MPPPKGASCHVERSARAVWPYPGRFLNGQVPVAIHTYNSAACRHSFKITMFELVCLQMRGHRVCILEKGTLQGRTQEWNISRHELQASHLSVLQNRQKPLRPSPFPYPLIDFASINYSNLKLTRCTPEPQILPGWKKQSIPISGFGKSCSHHSLVGPHVASVYDESMSEVNTFTEILIIYSHFAESCLCGGCYFQGVGGVNCH